MRFTINDVGHGFCADLHHDNGNVMLWDCGHKSNPENRPSTFLRARGISTVSRLFVTNYDEDHISDLPNLRRNLEIESLNRNKSITIEQLRRLKLQSGEISEAMQSLLDMMGQYTSPVTEEPAFPGVAYHTFMHDYGNEFDDTNNISTVTFLELPKLSVVIPGDLETKGWQEYLGNIDFCRLLKKTQIFIASHHGRENGYCRDVFELCKPAAVVFSDGPKKHATQEMAQTYANHASGLQFKGTTRYVFTTRKDGPIWWNL